MIPRLWDGDDVCAAEWGRWRLQKALTTKDTKVHKGNPNTHTGMYQAKLTASIIRELKRRADVR
jgi:hypothetical protein